MTAPAPSSRTDQRQAVSSYNEWDGLPEVIAWIVDGAVIPPRERGFQTIVAREHRAEAALPLAQRAARHADRGHRRRATILRRTGTPRPTARRMLGAFDDSQRHDLKRDGSVHQRFQPELSSLQKLPVSLIGAPKDLYAEWL